LPAALLWEQKLYLETNLPVRTILGGDDVVVGLERGIYRQFTEVEYLADTTAAASFTFMVNDMTSSFQKKYFPVARQPGY
jgi:hypothetical protein